MSTYIHKFSDVPGAVPKPEDFLQGEILVNTADGKLFLRSGTGQNTVSSFINESVSDSKYQGQTTALTALGDVAPGTDRLPYFNGTSSAAYTTLTSFARTLLDDTTAAAARTTLGASANTHTHDLRYVRHDAAYTIADAQKGIARTNINAQESNAKLDALSSLTLASNKLIYATGANALATTDISSFTRTSGLLNSASTVDLWQSKMGASATGAANGYAKLPNGIMFQWGLSTNGTLADYIVNFPTAFTSVCYSVVAAPRIDTGSAPVVMVDLITRTNFAVRKRAVHSGGVVEANAGFSVCWFAVGV